MKYIDVMGQPCPIPVIKAKQELAKEDTKGVTLSVDNIIAVQNLEKMANGFHYAMEYEEKSEEHFEVIITKTEDSIDNREQLTETKTGKPEEIQHRVSAEKADGEQNLVVVISRDTMGAGEKELGKILMKGFIFSLTVLKNAPRYLIFLNSGAYLTAEDSNTIEDIKKLEEMGTVILTCGTCSNYYNLQDKLAVGSITDMYGITEKMALADKVINI